MTLKLDHAIIVALAVKAGCDYRSIKKALRGDRVRGLAGYRARAALREAGFAVPEPTEQRT